MGPIVMMRIRSGYQVLLAIELYRIEVKKYIRDIIKTTINTMIYLEMKTVLI
jgi:hypothetical protein